MVGRALLPTVLIDPHSTYPFDFRVEKLSGDPVKQACDAQAMGKARSFLSVSIDEGVHWRLQQWVRFAKLVQPRAAASRRHSPGEDVRRSLFVAIVLVVFLFIVIVVDFVVRLSGVERVALVIPELAIEAIPGEQLRMRAALDRPAS